MNYFNWVKIPEDKTKRIDLWESDAVFAELNFSVNSDKIIHKRTKYSALDWLGDIGGLYDGLFHLFSAIMYIYRTIVGSPLNSYLVRTLFKRETKEIPEHEDVEATVTRIKQRESYFYSQLCSFLRRRREKKMFDKGVDRAMKELEIEHFIRSQKEIRIAIKAIFTRLERFLMQNN